MSSDNSMAHDTAMAIYAILFSASEPIELTKIKDEFHIPETIFDQAIIKLELILKEHSPLMLQYIENSVLIVSRPEYARFIKHIWKKQKIRLSDEAIETLTIIAYHQPITKAEIEQKRQKDSESVIETLIRHRFVEAIGELSKQGCPVLYKTTSEFLQHFGLKGLNDLPEIHYQL